MIRNQKKGGIAYIVANNKERMPRVIKIANAVKADVVDMKSEDVINPLKQYIIFPLLVLFKLVNSNHKVVIVNNIPASTVFSTMIAGKIRGFVVVVDFINLWEHSVARNKPKLRQLIKIYETYIYRYVEQGIAHCDLLRRAVERMGVKNCITILDCADSTKFLPIKDKNGKNVIVIANLKEYEGIDILLNALTIVKQKHPNICCYIIGDGPHREELQRLTKMLSLENIVEFTGRVPYEDVPKYLSKGQIGVAPTKMIFGFELPIKVFEYMASSLAVIATKTPCINTVIKHGSNGFLVNENDYVAMGNLMNNLFNDNNLLIRIQSKAREDVENELNWQSQHEKLNNYLAGVMQ
jgi:glycosyltransferase involved in cell wall biosynthesis